MALQDSIRSAVYATFTGEQRTQVIDGLETIPDESAETLRQRPPVEVLQAAVLVLSYGDLAIFHGQLMNACAEPRDVIYVLQSPSLIHTDLTQEELVRRYRELQLPIPSWLVPDA